MSRPLTYMKYVPVATETEYPYTRSQTCIFRKALLGSFKIQDYSRIQSNGKCDGLEDHILGVGTAIVTVRVVREFARYRSGILECPANLKGINHAVIAIGVTPDSWRLQNSWGARWGDEGYVSISKDPTLNCNLCGYSPFAATV